MGNFYGETRKQLRGLGLPGGDEPAESSGRLFDDGCQFRLEVPTINSASTAEFLLSEARRRSLTINRITETIGIFRHTGAEVRRYVELADEYNVEVLMSVGPRATYDIGGGVRTVQGSQVGYRLRGQEQVVSAIEDIKRAVDIGIRGIVVYDEGLLWVLNLLKTQGTLPADLHLKVSAHCGHGNPASARVLEQLGANSINPTRDLTIPIISAIRKAVSIPLDCHVDNPKSSGGFIRTYDAPDLIRTAAPVYLKTGNSALQAHGIRAGKQETEDILRQVEIVSEFLDRHYPEAKQSPACPRRMRRSSVTDRVREAL
jgi:hypothetical protein